MNGDKYPYKKTELLAISNVFIAEFNALRRELEIFIDHQKEITNFSILAFTAIVGAFGIIKGGKASLSLSPYTAHVYLVFPWIFYLLALLYADKTVRILRVADYLQNHLRKKIIRICGEYFWQWELYKMSESFPLSSRNVALRFDKSRWLIFIGPSLISIILFFSLYENIMKLSDDIIAKLLLGANAVAMIIIYEWIILRLEETMGVGSRENVENLDKYEKNKQDEVDFDIVSIIVQNFGKLPEEARNLLFELSEKDEKAGIVAKVVKENFDRLPKEVRNELLLNLSKKDKAAGTVAKIVKENFDKLPKKVRNELLLNLSKKDCWK